MDISKLLGLLQLAISLLNSAAAHPEASIPARRGAVLAATAAVSVVSKSLQTDIAPQKEFSRNNFLRFSGEDGILAAKFKDSDGTKYQLTGGSYFSQDNSLSVQLMGSDTSFGDMNRDGRDDAITGVLVSRAGKPTYKLVLFINQDGRPDHYADVDLGNIKTVSYHRTEDNLFGITYTDFAGREIKSTYMLLGKKLHAI